MIAQNLILLASINISIKNRSCHSKLQSLVQVATAYVRKYPEQVQKLSHPFSLNLPLELTSNTEWLLCKNPKSYS